MCTKGRFAISCPYFLTGFVDEQGGSVASANALLLRGLLSAEQEGVFFTKPAFVDPRGGLSDEELAWLEVVDCTNGWADGFRRCVVDAVGGTIGRPAIWLDSATYRAGIVRAMRREQGRRPGRSVLWLGDWAAGRVGDLPVVSFAQGPPGTDARSVGRHRVLIERLAGRAFYVKLAAVASWRLTRGLPDFSISDRVLVGSSWSRDCLVDRFGFEPDRVGVVPYPIDLAAFRPLRRPAPSSRLRVLWLGRIVPRKRLDVFLDGLAGAIEQGVDVEGWVIGSSGFVPNFERLIAEFPYPERLRHDASVRREEVPGVLEQVDVLAQPSDEENFGSSVAEALACGVPSIVGATNGTGDYVCERSVVLADDRAETFAAALDRMSDLKRQGALADPQVSREQAEMWFEPGAVVRKLEDELARAADRVRR